MKQDMNCGKAIFLNTLLAMCLFFLAPMAASAQNRIAYFSYDEAMKSMPEYVLAQNNIGSLRTKYDAEMKRAEDEFNNKYEEFLDGQHDFAPLILQKRQAELQELMQKNIAFKAEAERLLAQAEKDAMAPVTEKMKTVLQRIGKERGYAVILNTDSNACPYIDTTIADDITTIVKDALR
jgi:outer membrane protein